MAAAVELTVTHADNEVAAWVNGVLVYDKKTEGDPTFDDVVDLTPALQPGHNELVVIGINWGGPASFQGNLSVGGAFVTPFDYTVASAPSGMIWSQTFSVPYCC